MKYLHSKNLKRKFKYFNVNSSKKIAPEENCLPPIDILILILNPKPNPNRGPIFLRGNCSDTNVNILQLISFYNCRFPN